MKIHPISNKSVCVALFILLKAASVILPVLHLSFLQQVKSFDDNRMKDLVSDGQLSLKALEHEEGSRLHHCAFVVFFCQSVSESCTIPCAYRAAV